MNMLQGTVTKWMGQHYYVATSTQKVYQCYLPGKYKKKKWQVTNPIAVGDKVIFNVYNTGTGIINEILPRKNYIARQGTQRSHYQQVIAANIDIAILVACLKAPSTTLGFIDRFLAATSSLHIQPILLFNKTDLLNSVQLNKLHQLSKLYSHIGYTNFSISALQKDSVLQIQDIIMNTTTLLTGQSGIGKSTILNAILPWAKQKIAPICKAHKKGKHTTTHATMFTIDPSTSIIDTPGIQTFIPTTIKNPGHSFPEIAEQAPHCKYYNCTHIHEPACAVKDMVQKKNMAVTRYQSYCDMIHHLTIPQ